jgi:hypothetical protein
MTDIFVSYASEDRDRIKPLVEALQREGWSVWWDRDLVTGPSFDDKIEEALEAARCVVVAWSQHSVKSRWCRTEANEGLERQVLVPMKIDEVRPPLAFRSSQTASLIGWPQKPVSWKLCCEESATVSVSLAPRSVNQTPRRNL